MRIDIIENIHDFKRIKDVWNTLFNQIDEITIFQSFEYNYYSWLYLLDKNKNHLALCLMYQEEKLIAICPFYIDNRRRLRFINDKHSDNCDIISYSRIDIDSLLKEISSKFKINSFHFINLNCNSKIFRYKTKKYAYFIDKCSAVYSVLDLNKGVFPDNFSDYKSKHKTEFRRILKKHMSKTHIILNSKNDTFPLQDIYSLRKKMIDNRVRSDNFLLSDQIRLIEKLYIEGRLKISIVKNDHTINAISFVLCEKTNYLIWIDLYDSSKMINLFNYVSLISSFSRTNEININFGRGDYNYKISNFLPKKKELSSFYIFTKNGYKFIFIAEKLIISFLSKIYNILRG